MLNFRKRVDKLKLINMLDLGFALGGIGKELKWKNID
jgi:hypothetical protein